MSNPPTVHPAQLAGMIERNEALPVHLTSQCPDRYAAAVLSAQLNRLEYTVTVSEDHRIEARGVHRSKAEGYEVPA